MCFGNHLYIRHIFPKIHLKKIDIEYIVYLQVSNSVYRDDYPCSLFHVWQSDWK